MDRTVTQQIFTYDTGFTQLTLQVTWLDTDCHLLLWGGEKPHLGCTVLALPRPSLSGEGRSATASVLNVTGHKDEALCRRIAEKVAAAAKCTAVCCGGVHMDGITAAQIEAIVAATDELIAKALSAKTPA